MIPSPRPKLFDLYTLSQSKLIENHTLHSGTYLYNPYVAVAPPSGKRADRCIAKTWENVLVTWFIHILKTVNLQQLKGCRILNQVCERGTISQLRYTGVPCLSKMVYESKGLDLTAEPPTVKLYWISPRACPLNGMLVQDYHSSAKPVAVYRPNLSYSNIGQCYLKDKSVSTGQPHWFP